MDLNDFRNFSTIDSLNYLAEIDNLPEQLEKAWALGQSLPLPDWKGIQRVIVAGMGGSAIGADLLAAYLAPSCSVPLVVQRNYSLPAWARGRKTLLIASSHSGNTEETLAAFEQAKANGCRILAICTGGALAQKARRSRKPLWIFEHAGQPRAAVGYSFGLLLAVLARLGLTPDPSADVAGAIAAMRRFQPQLQAAAPVPLNPAKRLAGQLVGRTVSVFGADILEPVARRWKGQVSELAKTWAQFEALPEANHNTLAGLLQPEQQLLKISTLFLRSPACHPRNHLRAKLTRKIFMLEGLCTDGFDAPGETPLAQQWTAILFGDYTAYYLAILYDIDPTPVDALVQFKEALKAASG